MPIKRRHARQVCDPVSTHGEGACWDERADALVWVDMLAGRVLVTDAAGSTRVTEVGDSVAAFVRPVRGSADSVIVGGRSLWRTDLTRDGGSATKIMDLDLPQHVRCNEGSCSPDGRLFIGTMTYSAEPGSGRVVALTPSGLVTALPSTTVANGQQFVTRDRVLFVDSTTREICVYSVDESSTWTGRASFATLADAPGLPDGLCLDREGGAWVAMWEGGSARRYGPTGELTDEVTIPVSKATSVALGGPDLTTLYITTSCLDDETSRANGAGALFYAEVEVPGIPVDPWSDQLA